jgi:hypothetical protein
MDPMDQTPTEPEPTDSRVLSAAIIRNLRLLRDAVPTDATLRTAFAEASALARIILEAPAPPVSAAPDPSADAPSAAPDPTLTELELEEAREELRVANVERDAARHAATTLQLRLQTTTTQLNNALSMGAHQAARTDTGGGGGDNEGNVDGSGGYSNVPEFDGSHPDEIHTWILLLRNKLAAQAHRYPTESSKLRYAFGRLQGDAFDMVRSHMSEDTGAIILGSLNELLVVLRQAYDDPDRAHNARIAARNLKMRPLQFSAYLAAFRRVMGDLDWDDGAQRDQLNEGLTAQMKRSLEYRPRPRTLAELIELCVEYDARHRATSIEVAATPPVRPSPAASSSRPGPSRAAFVAPGPLPASRPAASRPAAAPVAHPTDANSGNYGPAPMNLSAADRLRMRNERMARGECTYCGVLGHFRLECGKRLAKEARDLRVAAVTTAPPAESGNELSHAA